MNFKDYVLNKNYLEETFNPSEYNLKKFIAQKEGYTLNSSFQVTIGGNTKAQIQAKKDSLHEQGMDVRELHNGSKIEIWTKKKGPIKPDTWG